MLTKSIVLCGLLLISAVSSDERREQIEQQIATLEAELDDLRQELAELENRADRRNVDRPIYNGRRVTPRWIEMQFERFNDKIAVVDGEYRDIGREVIAGSAISDTPPEVGSARYAASPKVVAIHGRGARPRVLQVIDEGEVIVTRQAAAPHYPGVPGQTQATFHVKGINTSSLVDDAVLDELMLIYIGTFRYTAITGATRTIQSYRVYEPLTPEQFRDALDRGFQLIEYREVTRRVRSNHPETLAPITREVKEIKAFPVR